MQVYHTSSISPAGAMLGHRDTGEGYEPGWYWQSEIDSDPIGPFDTEELAIADCREGAV